MGAAMFGRHTFPLDVLHLWLDEQRYQATYTDIVEQVRIVTTYAMWHDGIHLSRSVASVELEPIDEGTRFTHVEHGVFFDQFWADGPNREDGSRGLPEAPGTYLA